MDLTIFKIICVVIFDLFIVCCIIGIPIYLCAFHQLARQSTIRMNIKQFENIYAINPKRWTISFDGDGIVDAMIYTTEQDSNGHSKTVFVSVHWYSFWKLVVFTRRIRANKKVQIKKNNLSIIIESVLKDIDCIKAESKREVKEAQDIISCVANKINKEK